MVLLQREHHHRALQPPAVVTVQGNQSHNPWNLTRVLWGPRHLYTLYHLVQIGSNQGWSFSPYFCLFKLLSGPELFAHSHSWCIIYVNIHLIRTYPLTRNCPIFPRILMMQYILRHCFCSYFDLMTIELINENKLNCFDPTNF